MNSSPLTFFSTPQLLVFSLVAVIAAAVLCFWAWKRARFHPWVGGLELLRFALVCFAALLLNQPEWIEEYRSQEKPTLVVLWDASPSMETRDVLADNRPGASAVTRREWIEPLVNSPLWDGLRDKMNVVVEPFAGADAAEGSNLHAPLMAALEKHKNLRGLLLLSDGDWTTGPPPVQAASELRLRDVPVFAIPAGSPTRLPDVDLLSLDAPTFGVAGKSVRIPFTLESSLPRDYITTVTLRSSDGGHVSKEIRIAAMARTTEWVNWDPQGTGDFTVELEVPRHSDETLLDNNQRTAPISIREEQLKVLVVESYPRWEYRYLRNALSRDPGVEVSCLLFHPGLSKGGGGNADYIKEFPAGLDELGKYDVVFLGDVGMEDGQLTAEQCRLLKGLVEQQASGLVFMPGFQGRQFSLLDSELGELYPVLLDAAQPSGWGTRTASHFELTEAGRRSLLTRLADTQDDNVETWEALPGFQWYAPVERAKAGTEVLCVHKDMSNQYGRLPLLVTRTFGTGKVLFMGTDGAWRWRRGVEDLYHYRFWGQVVRWMAYARNMAKGENMRLFYSPDQPQLRQTLTLNVNAMETSGEPLHNGNLTARIVAPSGAAQTIQFTSQDDQWGAYAARYAIAEPGDHRIVLYCQQTNATLEASFFVQGESGERAGLPARPEVLQEIARVTKGQTLKADQLESAVRSLSELPEPPPLVRRVQLWSHPLMAALLIGLLGVFWVGRKAVGLI
jgi:hypothetical protein